VCISDEGAEDGNWSGATPEHWFVLRPAPAVDLVPTASGKLTAAPPPPLIPPERGPCGPVTIRNRRMRADESGHRNRPPSRLKACDRARNGLFTESVAPDSETMKMKEPRLRHPG